KDIGLSGSYVLAQFLLVIRAVLESRLAVRLVECGLLDGKLIDRKNPHQLWDLISQLDVHCCNSEDGLGVPAETDPELSSAYVRFLAISLQTYTDTRTALVRHMQASDGADEMEPDGKAKLRAKPSPSLTTNLSIEYRTLYAGTLVSLLLGRLDAGLLSNILEHICSEYAHRMASLTVVCFRVLVTIASFFPSSRDSILAAVSGFITSPPERLVRDLAVSGGSHSEEEYLIVPAASALAACMRLATSKPRIISTIHTLINTLAASRTSSEVSARTLRISRNVILVLSRLALLYQDAEITALVVSMVCAPRFTATAQLVPLVIESSASVAAIADVQTFGNVVTMAHKRVSFARDSDDSINVTVTHTMVDLAARVSDRAEIIESFFCEVLKSFIDASVEFASPAKFKGRVVTPLSTFLPILDALVSARGYAIDKEATAEQISLWRNFWFHMVIRGYVTERPYVKSYGRIFANLASKSPILVHPSSINYLETEIEYNSILQREFSDARLTQLRQALTPIVSPQNSALLRSIGFPQAVFLLAVYHVEVARARAGNCATVLHYFSNSAVTSSNLLPEVESIAELVILAYVRETTSRRWSVEVSLAGNQPSGPPVSAEEVPVDRHVQSGATSVVKAQVRELMVASCHHLEQVSKWAQHFAEKILRAFPQALLDKAVIFTLLELVQLVWKSCKAEQDDQFVPVYWFTSETLGITLQLPDSITYRKTLFARVSACAKRWLEMVGRAAPLELETLLQVYLSTPCDDNLDYEPHIGHSLAIEVGSNIRFGVAVSVNTGALATNSSAFSYRLGLRNYLRGHIGHGRDVLALKKALSEIYAAAKENPGMPLPEGGPSLREVIDLLQHATHQVVADAKADRELARLLVWVPLVLFEESVMRAATHMWTTLIVERADAEVLIMVELTIAWTWLIQQHLGIFSHRFEPKNPFAAKMSYTPSDKSARSRGYAVISRSLNPQTLLIEFLLQRFDSVKHLPSVNFNVVNAILRILQASFANCERITTNALARGPLFML
ncbi:phosphatidylinositol-4- kinase, partial [Linderina pennispora]